MKTRNLLLALALAASAAALGAQSVPAAAPSPGRQDPKASALVTAFEKKLNLEAYDITNTFTLIQKKEGEADRVLRIKIFRRDRTSSFTLLFEFPDSEKGKGYWRSGDDLYLYLPGTREFVYRNRKDDVGSTDVRTDIFAGTDTLSQYWASYGGTAMVSKWETDVVRLDARKLDVSFPIQRWFIRKTDGLPVKVENYSASGTLLRTTYYVDYQKIGADKYIFTKLLATDELDKGRKTLITNEGVSTAKIQDYVFSKAYLEEQSR